MKTYTPEELAEILGKHRAWLEDEEGGVRAVLRDADLSGADLSEVRDLWGASGNNQEIKALQCGTYPVTYTATHLQIGCQFHTIAEWWAFSADEIAAMDSQATAWWAIWKPILQNIIEVSPAVPGGDPKPEPAEPEQAA